MKKYWEEKVQLHAFISSALDGGKQSASHPGYFTTPYPLDMRLDWLQSQSRCGGKKKTSLPM
jgi:hypothetical protein